MTAATPGSVVSIYMDTPRTLTDGDFIRTSSGRLYEIAAVRIQERGKHAGRQHLRVVVMPPDYDTGDAVVHPLMWYRR